MPRTRAENAAFVIESLNELGLKPDSGSRLMRMHRLLTSEKAVIEPSHPDFETALEAERDLQILSFVFDQAAAKNHDAKFQRLVKSTLKDSVLPQEDRHNSQGRDAQFELFVAAICQRAGLAPVLREEPDVTCVVDGTRFGIAAKRIKNVDNLPARIQDAADQIEKARLPGIIALDTCIALNRENERITAPIPEPVFGEHYLQALKQFARKFHDRIQEWVRGKGVRGIVLHDQQVRLGDDGQWSLQGMSVWISTARENQRRNREFSAFRRAYGKGLPNLEYQ